MNERKKITYIDFERMFGSIPVEVSGRVRSLLEKINTSYREAQPAEVAEYILNVLKLMQAPEIKRSVKENFSAWEKGWGEQLKSALSGNLSAQKLKPKYFRPSKFLRYNKRLISIENPNLEYDLFTAARYILMAKYLSEYDDIYELGCGSCQNLLVFSKLFPSKRLHGLDWSSASVKITKLLNKSVNKNIDGQVFDMMKASPNIKLKPKAAIFTIHSLEQLGENHKKLLSFILAAKPEIVVHYEPIVEFYDQENLLDYMAFVYSQKRNYLSGFWPVLCKLREQNKIKILAAYRPHLGGVIHEASVLVWKALK